MDMHVAHSSQNLMLSGENTMVFTSLQPVCFTYVDAAGIVYYPQFFHLCHKTFEDFLKDKAAHSHPEFINDLRRGFPTVAIQSDFIASLRYGDIARVKLMIGKVGRSSVTFNYEIHRQKDLKLCFTASITKVFMNLDTHSALPIPDDLRALWENMM